MADSFDPYHEWLSIPPEEQPPHHYRLLGLKLFEEKPNVIENAADRQMKHLRDVQTGKHAAASQKLLAEISAAKIALLVPEKKVAYDAQLKAHLSKGKRTTVLSAAQVASPSAEKRQSLPSTLIYGVAAAGIAGVLVVIGLLAVIFSSASPPPAEAANHEVASTAGLAPPPLAPPEVAPPTVAPLLAAPVHETPPHRVSMPSVSPKPETKFASYPHTARTPAVNDTVVDELAQIAPAKPVEPSPEDQLAQLAQAPVVAAAPKKLPIPSTAEREAKRKEIAAIFPVDKARTAAEKADLAASLLRTGNETTDDPAARFALLNMAREVAAEAGQIKIAFAAIDGLAETFEFKPDAVRVASLETAAKAPIPPAAKRDVINFGVEMVQVFLAADRFTEASALNERLLNMARPLRDGDLIKELAELRKTTEAKAADYKKVQTSLETLKTSPDDAAANLAVGRYYLQVKGDWPTGMQHLAKSSDAALAALAKQELSPPADAAAQEKLADAWWTAADAEKEKPLADLFRARSGVHYRAIIGSLNGLNKVKADKRISEAGEFELATASSPPRSQNPFAMGASLSTGNSWTALWPNADSPLTLSSEASAPLPVKDGVLRMESGKPSADLTYATPLRDAVLRVRVKFAQRNGLVALWLREKKVSYSYGVYANNKYVVGCALPNNAWKEIASRGFAVPGDFFDVTAATIGDNIVFWVNGKKLVQAKDASIAEPGKLQIHAAQGSIIDISQVDLLVPNAQQAELLLTSDTLPSDAELAKAGAATGEPDLGIFSRDPKEIDGREPSPRVPSHGRRGELGPAEITVVGKDASPIAEVEGLPEEFKGGTTFKWAAPRKTNTSNGVLEFTVVKSGVVYILATFPETAYEGNRGGGWYEERITHEGLKANGWEDLGVSNWSPAGTLVLRKLVKEGETYKIRTNKYWPPVVLLPPAPKELERRPVERAPTQRETGGSPFGGFKLPTPLHQWTFNDDTAKDSVGTAHGEVQSGAMVKNGRLWVDGSEQSFVLTSPLEEETAAKTLVAWVSVADLDQKGGGVITIETIASRKKEKFDGIAFAEKNAREWIVASEQWNRSHQDAVGKPETLKHPTSIMVAITYDPSKGITMYRNGEPYVSYNALPMVVFPGGSSRVILGKRHSHAPNVSANLRGSIDEARLYGVALSAEQIKELFREGPVKK